VISIWACSWRRRRSRRCGAWPGTDERLGEPETNRELFDLLVRAGRIAPALAGTLRDMAGFRNVLVHGYQDVDPGVVEDVLRNHLGDLLEFVVTRKLAPSTMTA
jgi:uncharacterized protein YutE (UPF0331/DUF86 family)